MTTDNSDMIIRKLNISSYDVLLKEICYQIIK